MPVPGAPGGDDDARDAAPVGGLDQLVERGVARRGLLRVGRKVSIDHKQVGRGATKYPRPDSTASSG